MKKLQDEYKSSFRQKMQTFQELIQAVQKTPTLETLGALRFSVHKLAGSAGTYGFDKVSQICKTWELEIVAQIKTFPPDPQWLSHFHEPLEAIETALYDKSK